VLVRIRDSTTRVRITSNMIAVTMTKPRCLVVAVDLILGAIFMAGI
jgi:hypothetical protein